MHPVPTLLEYLEDIQTKAALLKQLTKIFVSPRNRMSTLPSPLPSRLLGVSLKMYFDLPQTTAYTTALNSLPPHPHSLVFLVPSFPALPACSSLLSKSSISLGAQNCHWDDSGAHTGEVSPKMLKQVGCTIVELGHAERREEPFREGNEMVAAKAKAAVRNGLVPLVCIGEKGRSSIVSEGVGIAIRECGPQVISMLNAVGPEVDVIFAYEPVWAIGAKAPASADHVLTVMGQLKDIMKGLGRTGEVRILYGGSAGPGTWKSLQAGADGLFLGRFAHDVNALRRVVEEMEED